VTCEVPVDPGVQVTGVVRESQIPAHAKPLFATVTTAGLLDAKEKVSLRAFPVLFLAVAVNSWFLPNSIETLGEGVSETLPGT